MGMYALLLSLVYFYVAHDMKCHIPDVKYVIIPKSPKFAVLA